MAFLASRNGLSTAAALLGWTSVSRADLTALGSFLQHRGYSPPKIRGRDENEEGDQDVRGQSGTKRLTREMDAQLREAGTPNQTIMADYGIGWTTLAALRKLWTRPQEKHALTEQEYLSRRAAGENKGTIAGSVGINSNEMAAYVWMWGYNDPEREREALVAYAVRKVKAAKVRPTADAGEDDTGADEGDVRSAAQVPEESLAVPDATDDQIVQQMQDALDRHIDQQEAKSAEADAPCERQEEIHAAETEQLPTQGTRLQDVVIPQSVVSVFREVRAAYPNLYSGDEGEDFARFLKLAVIPRYHTYQSVVDQAGGHFEMFFGKPLFVPKGEILLHVTADCPRCGKEHPVTARRLAGRVEDEFDYFATCSETGQPMYLEIQVATR